MSLLSIKSAWGNLNSYVAFQTNNRYSNINVEDHQTIRQELDASLREWVQMERTLGSNRQNEHFRVACVAYDAETGQYYYGMNRGVNISGDRLNPLLSEWLPEERIADFPLGNCAEVDAVNQALNNGASIENIHLYTINSRTFVPKPMCDNCRFTFGGRISHVYSG